jgi:hypothetical protein
MGSAKEELIQFQELELMFEGIAENYKKRLW